MRPHRRGHRLPQPRPKSTESPRSTQRSTGRVRRRAPRHKRHEPRAGHGGDGITARGSRGSRQNMSRRAADLSSCRRRSHQLAARVSSPTSQKPSNRTSGRRSRSRQSRRPGTRRRCSGAARAGASAQGAIRPVADAVVVAIPTLAVGAGRALVASQTPSRSSSRRSSGHDCDRRPGSWCRGADGALQSSHEDASLALHTRHRRRRLLARLPPPTPLVTSPSASPRRPHRRAGPHADHGEDGERRGTADASVPWGRRTRRRNPTPTRRQTE